MLYSPRTLEKEEEKIEARTNSPSIYCLHNNTRTLVSSLGKKTVLPPLATGCPTRMCASLPV